MAMSDSLNMIDRIVDFFVVNEGEFILESTTEGAVKFVPIKWRHLLTIFQNFNDFFQFQIPERNRGSYQVHPPRSLQF